MLENIKMILNISDDKYDKLIELYIKKVTNNVLSYCNIDELTPVIEDFIENKTIEIMKYKLQLESTGSVKSISRGDTKIEYNSMSTSIDIYFNDKDSSFLNQFRKLRFF